MTRGRNEGRVLPVLLRKAAVVLIAALALASCSTTDAENDTAVAESVTETPDATDAGETTTSEPMESTIGSHTDGTADATTTLAGGALT